MDKIEIKGLEVFAHHGVYQEEQRLGQKFVVSAVLSLDTTAAAQTDDLDKTVNYGAISRQITQILQRENHKLLERAAAVTAEEILLTNPLINGITIKIEKRSFVLVPMAQIAPWLRHPVSKSTIKQLLEELNAEQ